MDDPGRKNVTFGYAALQETVEQLFALAVECVQVADQKLDAVGVGNQQLGARQAADIFLALEHQLATAAVGVDLPGARAGKARYAGDAADFRHEFAAREFVLDQGTDGRRQVGNAVGPADFMAFEADQRNAFVRRGNRESAHRGDAFMALAVFARQDESTGG